MPRQPLTSEQLLRISERCAAAIADAGAATLSVAELASAAGISERSFYRYFPTKAECLRPLFDAGNRLFAEALAAQPLEAGFVAGLRAAFAQIFPDDAELRSRAIMSTVIADPALRRVWLEASYDTAVVIRPAVARLIGRRDAVAVTAACGQAVLLVMAGLEHLVTDRTHPSELADRLVGELFGADRLASAAAST